MIDPGAAVDPAARLGKDVSIGAGSIIGPEVEIGDRTWVGPHVVIRGAVRIGCDNRIYQFNSLGEVPQDMKYAGEPASLEIGDRNVVREFCTFNRGTGHGGGVTRIGDDNWIMAYVHVAHDCRIGSHTIMANGTTLAGHVDVADRVTFGAFTMMHQFCTIGTHAFTGMGAVILKDVPPFVIVSGNPAHPHGLNTTGLKRRGFGEETLRHLRRAYKTLYKQGLTVDRALEQLQGLATECPEVATLLECFKNTSRGVVR